MPKELSSRKKSAKNVIPYARGFHPSSEKKRIEAIGFGSADLPPEYRDSNESDAKFFFPVPSPSCEDDWLAQYAEDGQSYKEYTRENPWFSKRKQKYLQQKFVSGGKYISEKYPEGKIYIAKVGDFSNCEVDFEELVDYVRSFLCLPVEVLEGISIEEKEHDLLFVEDPKLSPSQRSSSRIKRSSLDIRRSAKGKHVQISIDSILPKMKRIIPNDALCLIGLTPYDLYADDTDLFVAGMASGNQRVAVFSLLRYNPALTFSTEFWYEIRTTKTIDKDEKNKVLLARSCKLVVHELCHLLGIDHCVFYSCCMNGSGHLTEDFAQPMMLCPVDLHKLQVLIGFDIKSRYKLLMNFYHKHRLKEEEEWTKRRLAFINSF